MYLTVYSKYQKKMINFAVRFRMHLFVYEKDFIYIPVADARGVRTSSTTENGETTAHDGGAHQDYTREDQGRSQLCWAYAMLATIESEHLMMGDSGESVHRLRGPHDALGPDSAIPICHVGTRNLHARHVSHADTLYRNLWCHAV